MKIMKMSEPRVNCVPSGLRKRLQSLFYDLAKEVPIGVLNQCLLNTVGQGEVQYSDKLLADWAEGYATQLIENRLAITRNTEKNDKLYSDSVEATLKRSNK